MCAVGEFVDNMDLQRAVWCAAIIIGMVLSIHAGLYVIINKQRREVHYAKAAFLEFIACWVMYIPQEYFNDLSENSHFVLRICESVVTALLKSFNVYAGNGYERVVYTDSIPFSSFYNIVRACANIAMILFIGGFIIKFLDGPLQKVKLNCHKKYKTYVFSECNDKTLAIAQSIIQSLDLPKKKIIFACAGKNTLPENKEKVDYLGTIYVDDTVNYVIQHLKKSSKGLEIFIFDFEEEKSLDDLEVICSKLKNYKGCEIKLYVELLKTPWSLYDDFLANHGIKENSKIVLNFIRSEENFIYNHLLEYSIFERFIEQEGEKTIKILIVGEMNDRNLELLKAVLHLGQMPSYKLMVYVIEASEDRGRLNHVMPEVKDEYNEVGDAIYSLHFWEGIDYNSVKFDNIICNEISDFTFAFVNVGDDLKNVNLAMRINAFCYRNKRPIDNYTIQANVLRQDICNKWNPNLLEGIEIIGSQEKIYDYGFITMSKIEESTKKIHEVRQEKRKRKKEEAGDSTYSPKTWIEYCNYEYNRHSVYARTLSFKYKVLLIDREYESDSSGDEYEKYRITGKDILDADGNESNIWKIYEHMRWNMYTRSLGYCLSSDDLLDANGKIDKKVRSIALVHNDLVAFDMLSKEEQQKDELELTPEIVDILKKI